MCCSSATPRKAFYSRHEVIPLAEASGKTAACDVAVYPPGIPVLYPGEEITSEIVEYLLQEEDYEDPYSDEYDEVYSEESEADAAEAEEKQPGKGFFARLFGKK